MLKSIVSALSQRLPAKQVSGKPMLLCTPNLAKCDEASPSPCTHNLSQDSVVIGSHASKQSQNQLQKQIKNSAACTSQTKKLKAKKVTKSSSKTRKHSHKSYKASKSYKQSHGFSLPTSTQSALTSCNQAAHACVFDASKAVGQASKIVPSCLAVSVHNELSKTSQSFVMNFESKREFDGAFDRTFDGAFDGRFKGAFDGKFDRTFDGTFDGDGDSKVDGEFKDQCESIKADRIASPFASFILAGGKYLRLSVWAAMLGCASVALTSCSTNDDLPEREVLVEDPVTFSVSGVSGELLTNVDAHLKSLAVIPKKRAFFYIREIKEVTAKALRAYGYYHPKIKVTLPDKDKKEDTVVKVEVDQGKPLYIRQSKIEILGEGVKYKVFKDLLTNTELDSYKILNHGVYEDLKSAIHNTALSMGFFDGKFTSKRILVYQDQNFADIELVYDSGKRYDFGDLIMNEETSELFKPSQPLQNFKQGDKFATKKISAFVSSLNQTGYYNSVDVRPVVEKAEDFKVPVEMHLERRANNNMRVGLGYSTDEGPRVLLEWNKPLLNSRGDSLSTLMTLTKITQDAQLVYKIPGDNPNLDYFTINAAQTHTDFNDTLSDRSQLAVHYIANHTGRWRRDYSLRFEYEDFDQAKEEGRTVNLMPGVSFSRRESSGGYDPTRGYSLSLEALGAVGAISDNRFIQLKGTYKGVIAPSDNTRLLFRFEQGANFGTDADELPPSLRFFAGGDNSIRGFGYRDRSAMQPWGGLKGAKYLTAGSLEFQFPMGITNSRLALFCDVGTATDDYKDELLYGPGIGYRFLSSYGIVRVDVAVGMQKNEDNVYQLHFAFGPEF